MNANIPKPGAKVAPPASSPASGTGVKVVKRQAAAPGPALREKTCSQCSRPFKLTPEQKFHLCPKCYQKAQTKRPAPPRRGTSVLTQITCLMCGIQEYLSIVPTDPSKALCAACHAATRETRESQPREPKAREPKTRPTHSNTR